MQAEITRPNQVNYSSDKLELKNKSQINMIDNTKDILISIAGIVVKGSLGKVGVNITDSVVHSANQLLSYIQYKLPNIARSLKSVEQPIDYASTYSAIEAVAKNDLEMQKLLQEMRQAIQNDQQVEHELNMS